MTWRKHRNGNLLPDTERPSVEQVIVPNLDAAYSLARWLVRDTHLAEDVVQDAVVRGLTYFASFRGGDPRAWLLRIVRNTAYSALAAQQQAAGLAERPNETKAEEILRIPDPSATPDAAFSAAQDAALLAQALAGLAPDLRECLILKEFEELSYKEIAQITGVPLGTVMSRLWRARKMLMGAATGDEHEP